MRVSFSFSLRTWFPRLFVRISWVAFKAFPKVADLAAPSGVGKDGKSDLSRESGDLLHLSCNALPAQTPKTAQGFCFTVGSEFKRAETKLREKHTAEKGWKQDVSNPPLSRSDLAGRNPDEGFAQAATPQRMTQRRRSFRSGGLCALVLSAQLMERPV
ncbi:hypothetical protein AT727_13030 [Desulfitobacterium hafniense]|uniref:Uncharacterized protein n=2 Tax=Desulfitobacterium hafniense TaxID=49338 RepID=Q24QH7_DESHY|nr:hypothetical protein AT727_13030 [Desulfitobacterium hafniense]BAE85715.1 hypothetical protein DSY3926 [Desulfitobacterium hafniense Y51]